MSKEAIEFLREINPSFKNMDINNTNTFGGEFLLYCIGKALKQGQSLTLNISTNEYTTKDSNSPIEFDSISEKLEKAFNDGVEAEKQRCGCFNIDNYR